MGRANGVKRLLAFLIVAAGIAVAQTSAPIQYFYDDLGRLTRVVDQSGNVATYTYDAVGNIEDNADYAGS